jgi:hypothetical protein
VNEGLLRARFGDIDQELADVIPRLMSLESDEYTRLLLNLSRSRSVGEAESPLAQAELSELLVLFSLSSRRAIEVLFCSV